MSSVIKKPKTLVLNKLTSFEKKELCLKFIKANATYKLKIANKFRYTTVESFVKALKKVYSDFETYKIRTSTKATPTVVQSKVKKDKKTSLLVIYALDKSSSMSGFKFNSSLNYIQKDSEDLKKLNNNQEKTFKIIKFGSSVTEIEDLKEFSKINLEGSTDMHTAVVKIANFVKEYHNKFDSVLIKLLTDGDNNVTKYSKKVAIDKIAELYKTNNVTFTTICSKADLQTLLSYGLSSENVISFKDGDQKSFNDVLTKTMNQTRSYAANVSAGIYQTKSFYVDNSNKN